MNRDEFMELVYETFADEPDNVLANGIIEAADAYVEYEKAQLSQEGTTKDTTADLIERQAAIDVIEAGRLTKLIDAETAVNGLRALPSVQPEPKEGEWIPVTHGRGGYECNRCREYAPTYHKEFLPSYCPNCGAKMKGAAT